MVYAQLYGNSTGWNGRDFSGPVQLIELCGTDQVIHLDGRRHLSGMHADAKAKILKRLNPHLVKGYQLMRGRSYTDSKPISPLMKIDVEELLETQREVESLTVSSKVRDVMLRYLGYEACCEVLNRGDGTITFCTRRRYTEHSHSDYYGG